MKDTWEWIKYPSNSVDFRTTMKMICNRLPVRSYMNEMYIPSFDNSSDGYIIMSIFEVPAWLEDYIVKDGSIFTDNQSKPTESSQPEIPKEESIDKKKEKKSRKKETL